jgi:hypothetical protein
MKKNSAILLFFSSLFIYSCQETITEIDIDIDPIFNPFDTITYTDTAMTTPMEDSTSFLGLHYHIFSKRCNQPACHDGTFEPDFRTVQSAYNSLVFHPVIKNTPNDDFPYRVTPGNAALSMMYKRISEHEPPNFEQMPSSGIALPDRQIELIKNWINDGAKDVYGNHASQTSIQPNCYGLVAYLPSFNNQRIDTTRMDGRFSSFYAPANQNIRIWFSYFDIDENGNEVLGNVLTYNKIKFSTNPYHFSNALTLNLSMGFSTIGSVFSAPVNYPFPHFQYIDFKPSDYGFSAGDVLYLRTYVQDSDHSLPTEIPKDDTPFYLQAYFSMVLQ